MRDQQAPNSGVQGEGSGAGDAPAPWFADDQKDYVGNKGWKSPAEAVTSAINLEKLLGADKAGRTVVLPKDEKDVDGMKAFRAKIGVPESADKYELPVPEGDGAEFAKTAAQWMFEAGVPKGSAQKIAEQWNGYFSQMVKEQQEKQAAQSTEQLGKLKTEWGADFDKNSEFARRFLRASGWDEAKVKQYEETFGTATMLKDFHGWGSKTGEHQAAEGDAGGGGFGPTNQAVQKQIDDLRQQRLENKVTQKKYLEEMDRLGPLLQKAN